MIGKSEIIKIVKNHKIRLDHSNFLIDVGDTRLYDLELMNSSQFKPSAIIWVSISANESRSHNTLLFSVTEGYNLTEIEDWIESYRGILN